MELGLSLGDSSRPIRETSNEIGLNFNTTLSIGPITTIQIDHQQQQTHQDEKTKRDKNNQNNNPLLHQLDLLPKLSFPWPPPSDQQARSSSPNSAASSFQMDLCIYDRGGRSGGSLSGSGGGNKRDFSGGEAYDQRASSRASDDDDNVGVGNTRKKLRLSKDQSAFLEESFKEHNTLNPKQKLALAKQLNLRPRQVEVWFQNRRARTKLKQTEVDCEYLKRCCETLTEENRRLHKELQELRALKTSNPFCMQLPATTLTMCPSCERVATNSNTTNSSVTTTSATIKTSEDSTSKASNGFPFGKPRLHPFTHTSPHSTTS